MKQYLLMGLVMAQVSTSAFARGGDPTDLRYDPAKFTRENANASFEYIKSRSPPTVKGRYGLMDIRKVRATQIGLGFAYADDEGYEWSRKDKKDRRLRALTKAVPIVRCIYPEGHDDYFGDDRHHERYEAWYWLDKKRAVVYIKQNLYVADELDCVVALIKMGSMYTFDEKGQPIGDMYRTTVNGELEIDPAKVTREEAQKVLDIMPNNVLGTKNDPYRSLAGYLREKGAFTKSAPFAEFRVANWLRTRMKIQQTTEGWETAIAVGLNLLRTTEAAFLRHMGECASPLRRKSKG